MKQTFRALLVFLLTYTQAFAAGPVIWNGTRSAALTSKGFLLSDGSIVDNDGGLNYVKNGHGELNATGWAAYADAAGTTPVACTGGFPTETVTQTTSSPLVGTGSILLTKDAASRQGEGISYAFSIDSAYASQTMQISLVGATGGTYSSNDLGLYVYDVTGNTVITPSVSNIASGTNFIAVTFAATANTSYRLCIHTKTTSASAYTYKIDSVFVGQVPSYAVSAANVAGRTDGSGPTAGYIGEQQSSVVTGVTGVNTGSYTTITSITLTAGVWDLTACVWVPSTASLTNTNYGIATATNSSTGHTLGDTASSTIAVSGEDSGGCVSQVRKNISGSTTYYLTMRPFGANVTGLNARLSAVRSG